MENIPQIIEIALLLLIFFLLGCIIGWFVRARIFRPARVSLPAPTDSKEKEVQISLVPQPGAEAEQNTVRPKTLAAPRAGVRDNLKLIKGVGPKIENKLNELGIYHFDQIAAWDSATSDWVDDYLSFKGRIKRDHWIEQAKKLSQ